MTDEMIQVVRNFIDDHSKIYVGYIFWAGSGEMFIEEHIKPKLINNYEEAMNFINSCKACFPCDLDNDDEGYFGVGEVEHIKIITNNNATTTLLIEGNSDISVIITELDLSVK